MPVYLPETEKAVYLDDDIIVQGKVVGQLHLIQKLFFLILNFLVQTKINVLLFLTQETFRNCMKPKSDQDMQLLSQMTVIQPLLRALSGELEIRLG